MSIRRYDTLPPAERDAVQHLADVLADEVGSPQLNDEALLRLGDSRPGLVHLVYDSGRSPSGYAQVLDGTAEISTRAPVAAEILDAAEGEAGDGMIIWAHGRRSPISPLAEARGYRRVRELWQMRRPLTGEIPAADLPDGVRVRPFAVGQDEQEWLRVNAAAFVELPDQSGWTPADLQAREAEAWFDPAGFLLADKDGSLLGFHWTKVHPGGVGEVYVIAVDPSAKGMRLGPALLARGLQHLRDRGCTEVLLYVDAANTGAVRLYERYGFTVHEVDVQWQAPAISDRAATTAPAPSR